MRQNLLPEFERRNLNVIYVDLWIDKTVNPARDSLNTDPGRYGMQLVAIGSNRDKLATLVNGRGPRGFG